METSDNSSVLASIKKDFYIYRNGVVADALKALYGSGKMIFGLTVPQFMELSKKYPKDINLGLSLWKEKNIRECRILALYIIPPESVSPEIARELIADVESGEEAEFLAFRLLRRINNARQFYESLDWDDFQDRWPSYCLEMFKRNLDQI